jgi:hypothetical protein
MYATQQQQKSSNQILTFNKSGSQGPLTDGEPSMVIWLSPVCLKQQTPNGNAQFMLSGFIKNTKSIKITQINFFLKKSNQKENFLCPG